MTTHLDAVGAGGEVDAGVFVRLSHDAQLLDALPVQNEFRTGQVDGNPRRLERPAQRAAAAQLPGEPRP